MQIVRGRAAGAPTQQWTDTFTGAVWADSVLPTTDGTTINNVFFPPGARTHWHHHEVGQVLIVSSGHGLICTDGEQPREIGPGDIVWVPPGERHWHGASGSSYLLHLAISLGSTEWFAAVSDEDHAAAPVPRFKRD